MAFQNVVDGQRELGEESCGRLQIGAAVVGGEGLHVFVVVLDIRGLQHLFGTTELNQCVVDGIFAQHTEVDDELAGEDVCHRTDAARALEVEARHHVLDELQLVGEVRLVLIQGVDDVRAVVVVVVAVAVGIGVVQLNADVRRVAAAVARRLAEALVSKRVGSLLDDAALSQIAFFLRVKVGIVALILEHGLRHLVGRHLHR